MVTLTGTPPRPAPNDGLAVLASIFLSMGGLLPLFAILSVQR